MRKTPVNCQTTGPALSDLIRRGQATNVLDYQRVITRRDAFRGAFEALYSDVDLVLSPAMAFTAPTLSQIANTTETLISGLHHFTCPFTMSGHPVVSMPGGVHSDGMPINVQLIAPLFAEERLDRVGSAFQRATEFHRRHPR